jgi:hypothetical protein
MLDAADAAVVRLAEVLAVELDAMAAGGEQGYAVAAGAKAYDGVLETLRDTPVPIPDTFEELLAELSTPTDGAAPTGAPTTW